MLLLWKGELDANQESDCVPYLLPRVLCCNRFPFGRQARLEGILWTLWVAVPGAHLIAETSLNTVSNNYFYRHHQVTVWLWAIFPPSMWQGCNGTSVCIWDIVIVCPRVGSHFMSQPESGLRSLLTCRTHFIWFNWTVVKVEQRKSNATLALADQYEYLMLCVQEGVMNCSTGASEKKLCKKPSTV